MPPDLQSVSPPQVPQQHAYLQVLVAARCAAPCRPLRCCWRTASRRCSRRPATAALTTSRCTTARSHPGATAAAQQQPEHWVQGSVCGCGIFIDFDQPDAAVEPLWHSEGLEHTATAITLGESCGQMCHQPSSTMTVLQPQSCTHCVFVGLLPQTGTAPEFRSTTSHRCCGYPR